MPGGTTHGGTVQITIVADVTDFNRSVRNAARAASVGTKVKVGFEVDDNELRTKVQAAVAAAGLGSINIGVAVDFAELGRQLRNVTRVIETYNRTQGPVIRIRFDTDGGLQSLLSSLQGTMSLGLGGGLIGPLTQLAKLSFVPLAVSAAQAAGAIALLPAAIGGLAGAMAVLKMGMSGISDAFSAASAAAEAAEDSTGDLAHEAQLAAESVQSAKEGIVRAQEGISDAYRGVADAQKSQREAVEDLNDAYRDQARELRDVNDELKNAELNTESAAISVARAKENLTKIKAQYAKGEASALDVREADLRVRTSMQSYQEAKQNAADTRIKAAETNEKGIENGDIVKSAKEKVQSANVSAIQATRSLRDAQLSLRDSNIALREALYAQAQATKSASGMTDEYEKALAKLAPNARDFVEKVRGLKDEFGDLKKTVQNNLFAGMGDSVAALAKDYLPALTKGLGAISTSTNTGVKDIFMMMRDPRAIADWGDMFDGMAKSMAPMLRGAGELGRMFATVGGGSAQHLPKIAREFERYMSKAANSLQVMSEDGRLSRFISNGIRKVKQLIEVGSQAAQIFAKILLPASGAGDDGWNYVLDMLKDWNEQLGEGGVATKLASFWSSIERITLSLINFGAALAGAGFGVFLPILETIAQVLEPVATWLATADGAAQLLVITLGGLYAAFKIGGIVTAASKALAGFSAAAAGASGTGGAVGMAGRLRYALGSAGLLGALGGPLGLGVTGALVVGVTWLGKYQDKQREAAEAAREHKRRVDELTDSLNTQTGELDKNGWAALDASMKKDGTYQDIAKAGVDTKTYMQAMSGDERALAKVNAALDSNTFSLLEKAGVFDEKGSDADERLRSTLVLREGGFSQQDYVAAYRGNADMRARMEEFHPAWGKQYWDRVRRGVEDNEYKTPLSDDEREILKSTRRAGADLGNQTDALATARQNKADQNERTEAFREQVQDLQFEEGAKKWSTIEVDPSTIDDLDKIDGFWTKFGLDRSKQDPVTKKVTVTVKDDEALARLQVVQENTDVLAAMKINPEISLEDAQFYARSKDAKEQLEDIEKKGPHPEVALELQKLKEGKALSFTELQKITNYFKDKENIPEAQLLLKQLRNDIKLADIDLKQFTDKPRELEIAVRIRRENQAEIDKINKKLPEGWDYGRGIDYTISHGGKVTLGGKTYGGRKTGGLIPSFAEGGEAGRTSDGALYGPGTGTSDSILGVNYQGVPTAWVSNRERVMTERSRAGGNEALQVAMNKGWQASPAVAAQLLALPKFAGGGTVALGNISGEGITTEIQQAMWDVIRAQFPEAVLSSATRTVMTEGHPDNHNAGRAIDLGGDWGNFPKQAAWIFANYGSETLELIHSPFDHNVKDRKDVGDGYGFYGSGTMAGHRDHIHWAMDHAPTDVPKLSDEQIQQIVNGTLTFDKLYDSNGKKVDVGDLYGVNEGTRVNSTYDPSLYPWSNDGLTNEPESTDDDDDDDDDGTPTTISGWVSKIAAGAARDYTQDFLGVFGISDNIPILEAFKAGVDADDDKVPWDQKKLQTQLYKATGGLLGKDRSDELDTSDKKKDKTSAEEQKWRKESATRRDRFFAAMTKLDNLKKSGKISQTEYDKRLANLQEAFYTEQTDADTAYANLKTKRDQENQGFDYQKSIKKLNSDLKAKKITQDEYDKEVNRLQGAYLQSIQASVEQRQTERAEQQQKDQAAKDEKKQKEDEKKEDNKAERKKLAGVGNLTNQSSREEIAKAILGEATSRGYSDQDATATLSTALQESDLIMRNNPQGWNGIYQQDTSYPGRDNVNTNISEFFNRLDIKRASEGASSDIWKNIFWLQQAPSIDTAENAFAGGRQGYMDEIKSKLTEAQTMTATYLYDRGGYLMPNEVGTNRTKKPEPVLTDDQWQDVSGILTSLQNGSMAEVAQGAAKTAISAIPGVGPAGAAAVDTFYGAMKGVNNAALQGLNFAQSLKSQGVAAITQAANHATSTRTNNSSYSPTYNIHGMEAQQALRLTKLRENREAMGYAGGRR